jgi:hypothetical protein
LIHDAAVRFIPRNVDSRVAFGSLIWSSPWIMGPVDTGLLLLSPEIKVVVSTGIGKYLVFLWRPSPRQSLIIITIDDL